MIGWRPLAFQYGRESATASAIRIVLLDWRVEVTIPSHRITAHAHRRACMCVPQREETSTISETAVLQRCCPVQPGVHILAAGRFDNAAELQAEFGGIPGCADVQRVKLLDVDRLRECRRAVVIEGNAVDDI